MSKKIQGPNHHFTCYSEDNSLLVQFILVEFLHAYQLALQIKVLVTEYLDTIHQSDQEFNPLLQIFSKLLGSLPQQDQFSFFRWTKGSLTKLKEYCEQFSRNSKHRNADHINLQMAVHQAWLASMHNLTLLSSLQPAYSRQQKTTFLLNPLKRAFNNLQIRFNQITRYIPQVVTAYWNNENVLLCLLRKRKQLAEIYGPDFFYKRFKWPLNADEIAQFIIKRYQKRGFDSLLPWIQELLALEEKVYDSR